MSIVFHDTETLRSRAFRVDARRQKRVDLERMLDAERRKLPALADRAATFRREATKLERRVDVLTRNAAAFDDPEVRAELPAQRDALASARNELDSTNRALQNVQVRIAGFEDAIAAHDAENVDSDEAAAALAAEMAAIKAERGM